MAKHKKTVQGGGLEVVHPSHPVEDELVELVVDDIDAIYTEKGKESRQLLIEAYYLIGKSLREAEDKYKLSMPDLIQQCAGTERLKHLHLGRTNLWFTLTIFEEYGMVIEKKEWEKLPEGENCSITKLKKLHTTPRPKKEPTVEELASALFTKLGVESTKELIKELQRIIKTQNKS